MFFALVLMTLTEVEVTDHHIDHRRDQGCSLYCHLGNHDDLPWRRPDTQLIDGLRTQGECPRVA